MTLAAEFPGDPHSGGRQAKAQAGMPTAGQAAKTVAGRRGAQRAGRMAGRRAGGRARLLAALALVTALGACQDGFDLGAFNLTRPDYDARIKPRPPADSRGVITYPSYQVALARQGDTVADMARRLGLDAEELARFNGLRPDTRLRPGELIALPRKIPAAGGGTVDIETLAADAIERSESRRTAADTPPPATAPARRRGPVVEPVRHRVERGETAYSIARLYGVSVTALAEWNGLGPDLGVRAGQQLIIPLVEEAPAPRRRAAARVDATPPGRGSPTPVPPSATRPLPQDTAPVAPPPSPELGQYRSPDAPTDRAFLMPVEGRIVNPYTGKGKNEGIDIAAAPGTPVKAAEDGTVALVSRAVGAGTIVLIRHADNIFTVYANLNDVSLKKGDRVRRGQTIGTVAPGDPTILHFEVRRGAEPVDPMPFL